MKSIQEIPTHPGRATPARASAAGRFSRFWLVPALLFCGVQPARGAAMLPAQVVHQVKAAFIFNFTKFVEWPASRFESGTSPIVVGVLSTNTVGEELRRIVKDRQINGRDIVVRNVATSAEIQSVHVLFVGTGEEERFAGLTVALQGIAVLTVGESPKSAGAGGMINFVLQGNNVRFEINQDAAEQAGLRISSQLLKLATEVRKKN